jgi:hypothetical protein
MSIENLVSRYITSTEKTIKKIHLWGKIKKINTEKVEKIIECAKAYLQDAKYYKEKKRFEVSLTAIAYCEGLIDALEMLDFITIRKE